MRKLKYTLVITLLFIAGISKSQNTGPVAPEAVAFEPVDATDMVNLVTGDFTYVIPLLNVPSPEGGYPIALSYHGGVTMDQEASWVGLGWNVNPGAINRKINGVPDDWYNIPKVTKVNFEGGSGELYSIGVGVGLGSRSTVSIGLSYTWGDYKAFGGHIGIMDQSGVGGSISFSSQGSVGVNIGNRNLSLSANSNGGFGISGKMYGSSVGVNFNSSQINGSVSIGGIGVSVSNHGSITNDEISITEISGGMSIPIYMFYLSFDYYKMEYWSYNEYKDFYFGSLYMNEAKDQMSEGTSNAIYYGVQNRYSKMDSYLIPFDESSANDQLEEAQSNNLLYAAYDDYNVTAQGLSGKFSPKIFNKMLLTGDSYYLDAEKDKEVIYRYWENTFDNSDTFHPNFYFNNELSGYIRELPGEFNVNYVLQEPLNYNGDNIESSITYQGKSYDGYNNNRKVSGNYIEYYTNEQIISGEAQSKGFIVDEEFFNEISAQTKFDPKGIGGFKITTLDGKSYHYSIPVYNFEEVLRKNKENSGDYSERITRDKYAFSWLLTAITGPDFVDRGGDNNTSNGFIDDRDYGYWIKLAYGKLPDGYIWQFPYDLGEITYEEYSEEEIQIGRKQIYYLNSIESRSHIALFIKNFREDGVGKVKEKQFAQELDFDWYGYSLPEGDWKDENGNSPQEGWDYYQYTYLKHTYIGITEPIRPLLLEKIILLDKKDVNNVDLTQTNSYINHGFIKYENFLFIHNGCDDGFTQNCTAEPKGNFSKDEIISTIESNYDNLFLADNINISSIESYAIKIIDFSYKYDLCRNTPNSESYNSSKLSLTNVEFRAKNNKKIIPSYMFKYNQLGNNSYNIDSKDVWGYDKSYPDNWSLSEIILPTGAKVNIEYEQNTFKNEAIYGNKIPLISSSFNESEVEWQVKVSCDLKSINVGDYLRLKGQLKYYYTSYDWDDQEYPGRPNGGGNETESVDCIIEIAEVDEENGFIYFEHDQCLPYIGDYLNNQDFSLDNIYFIDAYFVIPNGFEQRGGGVRVKEVNVIDELDNKYTTEYNYNIPGTNYTSGTICYSPYMFSDKYVPYITELPLPKVLYEYVTVTERNGEISNIPTGYRFEVYQNVSQNVDIDFSLESQFQVINNQKPDNALMEINGDHHGYKYGRSTTLVNNFSSLGRLKSVVKYNNLRQQLEKEKYEYYEPSDIVVGTEQETFNYMKRYLRMYDGDTKSDNIWQYNATSKITYPNILKSKSVVSNGLTKTIDYTKHDFYSGNVLQTQTTLPNGNILKSEVLPAYQVEGFYDEMGPMALNENNKNMLSQQAASLTYLNDEPIGVSVQTWNDIWTYREYRNSNYVDKIEEDSDSLVWRKHKQFVWKGDMNTDGTYGANFGSYDTPDKLVANWSEFNEGSTNKWEKVKEITRYNHYSAPLESMDIDSNYASARMDIHSERTIASAANASYRQFTYTGFEQEVVRDTRKDFGGEVFGISNKNIRICSENASSYVYVDNSGYTQIAEMNSHTGDFFVKVTGNSVSSTNTGGPQIVILNESPEARKFMASVWVHMNSVAAKLSIESGSPVYMDSQDFPQFGNWILMSYIFEIPGATDQQTYAETVYIDSEGSGNIAYFDDFRVHPIDAPMQSYVYDKHTGAVTAILDNNNIATKYEYDDAGKLKTVLKEVPGVGTEGGFKPVSRHNYGYARATDQVFSIVSDIVEATGVNPYTQQRNVSVSFTLRNNDLIEQDCNLTLSLEDYGDKTISTTLGPKSTVDVTANWDVDNGSSMVKQLTISGDVEQQENISIDVVPEELSIINFEAINQGDGSYRLKVKFKNVGGSTGSWPDLKWDHYGVESTDFTETVTLVAGQSSVEYYSDYYYLEDGSHTFRILDGDSMVWGNPQIITIDVGGTGY